MSQELFDQVKESVNQLTLSEKTTLIKYLLDEVGKVSPKELAEQKVDEQEERSFGLFPGGWISEDFDKELPDDFWLGKL